MDDRRDRADRGETRGHPARTFFLTHMGYEWSFGFLWRYERLFVTGIEVTLAYTLGTILLGLVLGLAIGVARLSKSWLINAPLVALTEIFRCTPLLVQIVWFYYALPVILG